MKGGFADAAFSRFRTLYELSIIARFIHDNCDSVAKSFYEAYKNGTEDKYSWAKVAECFRKNKRITFRDIQATVNQDDPDGTDLYRSSSGTIHADPLMTFGRISTMFPIDKIPVGPSNFGMDLPGINAMVFMTRVNEIMFDYCELKFKKWTMYFFNTWVNEASDEFIKVLKSFDGSVTVS